MASRQSKYTPNYLNAIAATITDNITALRDILQEASPTNVTDVYGNNLLQLSILYERRQIFDYLLSLDQFDLETLNDFSETALMIALDMNNCSFKYIDEYYALKLIEKGVNINPEDYTSNTLLHSALSKNAYEVAKVLVLKGLDPSAYNHLQRTPLHTLFLTMRSDSKINDFVDFLLTRGVDLTILDYEDYTPLDLAILNDCIDTYISQSLIVETLKSDWDKKMLCKVFFKLMMGTPSIFFLFVDEISVVLSTHIKVRPLMLLSVHPEILKSAITNFEDVVEAILYSKDTICEYFEKFQPYVLKNFEILLNSDLEDAVAEFIGTLEIAELVEKLVEDDISDDVIQDLIFYLLTFGLDVSEDDLEYIYKQYGYCELFKTMLLMDVRKSEKKDIVPRIIYDLDIDIEAFIKDERKFYSLNALRELSGYFSHQELKNIGTGDAVARVPLLGELSRESARKFLIKKFKITKIRDFVWLVNRLAVPKIVKQILTYEQKLY